jgi:hypothetical protein
MNRFFFPRGIRNNNPGNIRIGKIRWQGQKLVQADSDFLEFTDVIHGLRALMCVLLTYHLKYDLDTVESLINRFAPPRENATDHYIYAVSKALRVKRNDILAVSSKSVLIALAIAISRQENGAPPDDMPPDWYARDVYEKAAALALQHA